MWQWLVAARVASNYKSFIINKYEYRNKWFIIPVFFCVAAEFVCLNVGRLQCDGACDPFNTKCKRVFIMSNFDWSPIIHILLLCSRFGKMPSHMVFVASQIDMFLGIFSISTLLSQQSLIIAESLLTVDEGECHTEYAIIIVLLFIYFSGEMLNIRN